MMKYRLIYLVECSTPVQLMDQCLIPSPLISDCGLWYCKSLNAILPLYTKNKWSGWLKVEMSFDYHRPALQGVTAANFPGN